MITPKAGGQYYDDADMVFLFNQTQTIAYLYHGAHLYDVFLSNDNKLVYVFSKKETQELYQKWKRYELELPNRAGDNTRD